MAVLSRRSSNNWILSLKVLLLSIGVLSMAMILKLSVPIVLQFFISGVPLFWITLLSWLTPPYLYVVINGIIITIAASSRFHHNKVEEKEQQMELLPVPGKITSVRSEFGGICDGYASPLKIPLDVILEFGGVVSYNEVPIKNLDGIGLKFEGRVGYDQVPVVENRMEFEDLKPKVYEPLVSEKKSNGIADAVTGGEVEDDDFMISRLTWMPTRTDSGEIPPPMDHSSSSSFEKPPVSSRFNHRKTVKASPEGGNGKALGVTTKPKRHDTLENTWKAITDGRHMPLTRHLKKSDTWETHGRHHHNNNISQESSSPLLEAKVMKKSETFQERNTNYHQSSASASPSSSGKLRKESSLSQEDLNRRVEAFINKFNEEMRLQRQESLNQYKEMVHRGTRC